MNGTDSCPGSRRMQRIWRKTSIAEKGWCLTFFPNTSLRFSSRTSGTLSRQRYLCWSNRSILRNRLSFLKSNWRGWRRVFLLNKPQHQSTGFHEWNLCAKIPSTVTEPLLQHKQGCTLWHPTGHSIDKGLIGRGIHLLGGGRGWWQNHHCWWQIFCGNCWYNVCCLLVMSWCVVFLCCRLPFCFQTDIIPIKWKENHANIFFFVGIRNI